MGGNPIWKYFNPIIENNKINYVVDDIKGFFDHVDWKWTYLGAVEDVFYVLISV